jgi:predicted dehydrogenase
MAIQVGSIGAGGYAAFLLRCFDEFIPQSRARIAAVSTSRPKRVAQAPFIVSQEARVVKSAEELLAIKELDAVIVPTSIDSHLHYTKMALEAGKQILCEKSVTATVQDAYEMIKARDAAEKIVAIGYQAAYSRSCQWAKKTISAGKIGEIKRAKVWATWPRPESYYARNSWAGKIKTKDGAWVLDSPACNALAHQINLLLWLTNPDPIASNRVTWVEAELYRVYDIENYDTCAIRAETETGCELLILLTHACAMNNDPLIEIEGENGTIRRIHPDRCQLIRRESVIGGETNRPSGPRAAMFENWLDCIEGKSERPASEIENALEVTRLVCAVSECSPIVDVNPRYTKVVQRDEDNYFRTIRNIESLFERCFDDFKMPHETRAARWTKRARSMDMGDYDHFEKPFSG